MNIFVHIKSALKFFLPLIVLKGIVLDYQLYFYIILSKFLQTYKKTKNNIPLCIVDTLDLEANTNLQGGIRYFSLAIGKL